MAFPASRKQIDEVFPVQDCLSPGCSRIWSAPACIARWQSWA